MKRLVFMLIMGLLVAALLAQAKTRSKSFRYSQTITGVGSGDDSTSVDSHFLFSTQHYANRYWITVEFDSVTKHEPSGFGLRDSIFVAIYTEYEGQRILLDSTEDSLFDATTLTLDFTSGLGDTLHLFGERMYIRIRIADTVGATTDSVHTFNYIINWFHAYQD